MHKAPRPRCAVAVPLGQKKVTTGLVDFDAVFAALKEAIERAGFEAQRTNETPDRLLLAEYVVADLTRGDAGVAYGLGLRDGMGRGRTLVTCAEAHVAHLPFDVGTWRMVTYRVGKAGALSSESRKTLVREVGRHLRRMARREVPEGHPLAEVIKSKADDPAAHQKTDIFLSRMPFVSDVTRRIGAAVGSKDSAKALKALDEIERELAARSASMKEVTAWLALFLGYREKGAYRRMSEIYAKLPSDLQRTAVAREQLALALNRQAEAAAKSGRREEADDFRARALGALDEIPDEQRTSETFAIAGRVYKGHHQASQDEVALGKAIDAYEEGFRRDPRDTFPGVNAVTLRIVRGSPDDEERLKVLTAAVTFSIDRAPPPSPERAQEAYWQRATKLEMASGARDWAAADRHLADVLACAPEPWMQPWMFGTTLGNLELQKRARRGEEETVRHLDGIQQKLAAAAHSGS